MKRLELVSQLHLKLLEPHRTSLEKCVYCPKLSRAACPVSNAETNETVTPWGKMSMAYFAARGDVPLDARHADPAWACSACYACRERCDHKNEVATVLTDARAEFFARGLAPEPAQRVSARFEAREEELRGELDALSRAAEPGAVRVLIGCGYVRHAPDVARDALEATEALVGAPARPVRACCGLPLLYAGDRPGFEAAARRLAAEVADGGRFVAVDPGCARAVRVEYARVGVSVEVPELFVDLARASLDRLQRSTSERRVRYHDPCQLGRGLDRYDAPREILARITGRPPEEFIHRREHADCSGGGGLVPATRPASSAAIADGRIAEHRALGGGLLVTHCAQSLRRFRTRGEPAEDLASLVARAVAPR
ncbi:Fe-S oxidoreductase [Sorangium cellulosum]|uniref:Fe-S oxidoreductase n=1 Tax=Sorangium cellulosum TaxID=56 RepID=A0A4P2QA78_SORCE|nr:(Fe-S)-binding protein [Sorangium cellulosum]AUX26557.1 Fe-S oxidoreductase [Sorangium cellulosum]